MAATVKTKEYFGKDVTSEDLDGEIRLRVKAGAIRSWVEDNGDNWILWTEWNVIGEQ